MVETDDIESPLPVRVEYNKEAAVEALLNIDNVDQAVLEAINDREYNIADHVPSGGAEEPSLDYWIQVLPPAPRGQGSTGCGTVSGQRAHHGHCSFYTRPVVK